MPEEIPAKAGHAKGSAQYTVSPRTRPSFQAGMKAIRGNERQTGLNRNQKSREYQTYGK
ncbi:hypothetical protein [Uliginosibacterium sp. TH139]|uniref:hypothetical protein n=1 Tax=Uliginosibacterium sp. TH139 TaxID=2067453 RepID=UPI0013043A0C|nr:hypothetical protein [Uliginosibacterium sp. TH139]